MDDEPACGTDHAPADHIALVSLNRPAQRNAMNAALISSLHETFDERTPFGVQMTKVAMWSHLEVASPAAGIDLENRTQLLASTTGDVAEAMQAFIEKRAPHSREV